MATGFSDTDLIIIKGRSGGRCEICGSGNPIHTHHRKPRRSGGTTGPRALQVNNPSNALRLCGPCHDTVESDRDAAVQLGRLVPEYADPAETPVLLTPWCGHGWYLLGALGGYEFADEPK